MITSRVTGPVEPAGRRGRRAARWGFVVAFVICAGLDLVCEAVGWDGAAGVFQPLAVPLLAGVLFAARPPITRTVVLLVGALLFSWLGDTVGELGFLAKIGLFLVAQWFYIAAFWPYRARSVLHKPVPMLGYAALLGTLIALLIGPADGLAVPVVIYGASLVTMAVFATGLQQWGTIGGLSFMVSDALLGINRFYDVPAPDLMDFLIMLSYLAAQAMLVRAVVVTSRPAGRTARGGVEPLGRTR